MTDIRVLVVEDHPPTADAHRRYLDRIDGFTAIGVAHTAAETRRIIREARLSGDDVDLVLLDLNLPDGHGLHLCRELRAAGLAIDVIAVTAVRDLDAVRQAVASGVVQYLIKPFTFEVFAGKLRSYREYFARVRAAAGTLSQQEVDTAFAALRTSNLPGLPKGLAAETLDAVTALLTGTEGARSASEVAEELGLSRVTARRYLEYLADHGTLSRAQRRGSTGRPQVEYRHGHAEG